MAPHSTKLNYKTAAAATSEELRLLRVKTETIQDAVSKIISQAGFNHTKYSQELQSLDYITQSLDALSQFWESLCEQTPQDWTVESTNFEGMVKLKELSDGLSGIEKSAENAHSDNIGFCDIF